MPVPKGIADLAYDSGSCAAVVVGTTLIPFTKFATPKTEVKISKISRIGDGRATRRTPGKGEVSDLMTELLVTDFEILLAAQNVHGATLIEHEIISRLAHPGIISSFSTLLSGARIISIEGPDLDGSEKEAIMKVGWSVLQRWDRAGSKTWKCLTYETGRASAQAKALMDL